MSPEWAPTKLDPQSPELLPALVGLEAPPVMGLGRKVLRLRVLLESMLAGKLVPVSTLVPDPVPGIARIARPPTLAYRAKVVREALSANSPPFC